MFTRLVTGSARMDWSIVCADLTLSRMKTFENGALCPSVMSRGFWSPRFALIVYTRMTFEYFVRKSLRLARFWKSFGGIRAFVTLRICNSSSNLRQSRNNFIVIEQKKNTTSVLRSNHSDFSSFCSLFDNALRWSCCYFLGVQNERRTPLTPPNSNPR